MIKVRLEFLWKTDEYLSNYARFSDTKAAFTGATAISLFGGMLSQHLLLRALQLTPAAWPSRLWFSAAGAAFLLASMGSTIWAVYPRLRTTRSRGIVFWADIATYTNSADFTSTMLRMGSEELTAELTQHIYDVASTIICTQVSLRIASDLVLLARCDQPRYALVHRESVEMNRSP